MKYDELDNQIIEALTINPRLQWSYQQRRAVKALVLHKQLDALYSLPILETYREQYHAIKSAATGINSQIIELENNEYIKEDTEREAQLYLIARWAAKHNNYAWSKMTDGEKREEIEFVQKQAPYKELLTLIAGLKSV